MTKLYQQLLFILLLCSLSLSLTACSSKTVPELREPLETSQGEESRADIESSENTAVETTENLSDIVKQDNPFLYNYRMRYEITSPHEDQDERVIFTGEDLELTVDLEVSGFRSVGIMIMIDGVIQPISYQGDEEHIRHYKSFGIDNPYMIECHFEGNEQNDVYEKIPLEVAVTTGSKGLEYPLSILVFNEPSRDAGELLVHGGVHGFTRRIYFEADSHEIAAKIEKIDQCLKSLDSRQLSWTHEKYASFLNDEGESQIDTMVVQWFSFDKDNIKSLYEQSLGKEAMLNYGLIREDGSFNEDLALQIGLPIIDTTKNANLDVLFHFAGPADHRLKQILLLDYYPLQMGQGTEYACSKEDYFQIAAHFDFSDVDRYMTLFSIIVDNDAMNFYDSTALTLLPGSTSK